MYEGEFVRLLPYAPGYFRRDFPAQLWQIVEEEKASHLVAWGRYNVPSETPIDRRGDLLDFLCLFTSTNGAMVVVQDIESEMVAGFIWFEEITPGFKAHTGIFMRQRFWGDKAREAGRLGLKYAFEQLNVIHVWAQTPWENAAKFCQDIGFKPMARLNDFARINGKVRDVTWFRADRRDFHG